MAGEDWRTKHLRDRGGQHRHEPVKRCTCGHKPTVHYLGGKCMEAMCACEDYEAREDV